MAKTLDGVLIKKAYQKEKLFQQIHAWINCNPKFGSEFLNGLQYLVELEFI